MAETMREISCKLIEKLHLSLSPDSDGYLYAWRLWTTIPGEAIVSANKEMILQKLEEAKNHTLAQIDDDIRKVEELFEP